jgi:hypothetical protein
MQIFLMLAGPQAGQGDPDTFNIHTAGHHTPANVGGDVVAEGVAQVSSQVSKGTLTSGLSLHTQ